MKLRYQALVILYSAIVFYGLTTPRPPIEPPSIPGLNQMAHFALFAGMAGLMSLGYYRSNPGVNRPWLFRVPLIVATLYGMLLEIVQLFIPTRSFEWADILLNFLGALAMQWLLCGWVWRPSVARTSGGNPGGSRGI